jgi:hypothetical protein
VHGDACVGAVGQGAREKRSSFQELKVWLQTQQQPATVAQTQTQPRTHQCTHSVGCSLPSCFLEAGVAAQSTPAHNIAHTILMLWLSLWSKSFEVSHRSAPWTLNVITHSLHPHNARITSHIDTVRPPCCKTVHTRLATLALANPGSATRAVVRMLLQAYPSA